MDDATLAYYNRNAAEVARAYESASEGVSALFPFVFSKGKRILDIGCGSGRDLSILLGLGLDAFGVEPSEGLRTQALKAHPELTGRVFDGALPDRLPGTDNAKFDAILLSAVIMHIPESELFDAAFAIRERLVDGGTLLVSFSTERGDTPPVEGGEGRDDRGRLMILRSASRVRLLFERLGFVLKSEWSSSDATGRRDVSWATLLFRYSGSAPRPVDRLESILSADRKVATYKLALIRALCDLALTGYNTVRWASDGSVAVPLRAIAELWVGYYWPLFESPELIPQINAEGNGGKPVGFRAALTLLIKHYRMLGGLSAFARDSLHGSLDGEGSRLYDHSLKIIGAVIVKGPVQFSGGAIGRQEFRYEASDGTVRMDEEFWREIVLMAHWVRDAIIVRWAEMTSNLAGSERGLATGDVLERLLSTSTPLRADEEIRAIYEEQRSLECVWSGKSLTASFAIDHALPFALWQDSSSWNLFPSHPKVNNEKRDKLPSREIVDRRRDAIIFYWEILNRAVPRRFSLESRKLAGSSLDSEGGLPANWESILFSRFVEAIEYTAASRGVLRWPA